MIDILECVPKVINGKKIILRDVQRLFLLYVQENWDALDIIVGCLPVAAGKSICAYTIMEWCRVNKLGQCAGVVPTLMLQDQYSADFPDIFMLKGARHYTCQCQVTRNNEEVSISCEESKKLRGCYCGNSKDTLEYRRDLTCVYRSNVQHAANCDKAFFTFHSMSYNNIFKRNLIIDEGHNAEKHVLDRFGTKIYEFDLENRDVKIPDDFASDEDFNNSKVIKKDNIISLLNSYISEMEKEISSLLKREKSALVDGLSRDEINLLDKLHEEMKKYTEIVSSIQKDYEDYLILLKKEVFYTNRIDLQQYNKKEVRFIYIKPKDIKKIAEPLLWPKQLTKKIIFLSATFKENDLETLGLSDRKYGIFNGKSPIPKENRPIRVWPLASMSYRKRKESTPIISAGCLKIADKHSDEKGIIHCTYDIAEKIKNLIHRDSAANRFIFHTTKDKTEKYNLFRDSKYPSILVASGMSEGIDLPDDLARWQIISMLMKPNISDDVNYWNLKNNIEKYNWETIRMTEQQSGRICRHETDKGVTYILVTDFYDLYRTTHINKISRNQPSLWDEWFVESIKWPDGKER
jgi:Rad3-related DNA helicase